MLKFNDHYTKQMEMRGSYKLAVSMPNEAWS